MILISKLTANVINKNNNKTREKNVKLFTNDV